jgi:hypothetical protein
MKIIQHIQIGTLSINTIGEASIVQIGTSGMIQSSSESYNIYEPEKPQIRPPVPDTYEIVPPDQAKEEEMEVEVTVPTTPEEDER